MSTCANAAPERVMPTEPMAKDGPLEPRVWIDGDGKSYENT